MSRAGFFRRRRFSRVARSVDLARAGLVCGAVTLITVGIGMGVYLQDRSVDPLPAAPEAAVAEPTLAAFARLPRSRPEEPPTTGSIDRRRSQPALSLEDAIRRADTARAEMEAAHIERLRSKAVLIATSWAECDEVTASDVLQSRGKPEGRLAVRIRCANGTRFYLDQEEIEANRLPALAKAAAGLSDAEAVGACEAKVRSGLAQPSSLRRRLPSTDVAREPGSGAVVTFDFDARNGFGFPLAMQAQCIFAEREIARMEVSPR
jgi:hypothetical protein